MNVERNKSVVHRLFDEIWNGRQFDAIDELYAPDYVADYRPYAALRVGRDSVREMVERIQLGDWGPLPPTGKRLEFEEMLMLTFNDSGRVVHQRGIVDNLAGLRQAGVMPTPKQ